jgi:arsenate reductase
MTEVTLVKRNVLFLCTGNSCRSQMAEGLVNHQRGDEWHAVSAGTHPTGYVHPVAIAALKEIGVDISAARSKSADGFRDVPFDLVVTVCDDAAENCPLWLGQGKRAHLGFPDPAKASGDDEQVMAEFRAVRDAIRARVIPFLDSFGKETP